MAIDRDAAKRYWIIHKHPAVWSTGPWVLTDEARLADILANDLYTRVEEVELVAVRKDLPDDYC